MAYEHLLEVDRAKQQQYEVGDPEFNLTDLVSKSQSLKPVSPSSQSTTTLDVNFIFVFTVNNYGFIPIP